MMDTLIKGKVTVIMPAKDEETRIEEAIKQFRPYVDSIIIIEDGSKDRTLEIAKQHADKVIELGDTEPWPEMHQSYIYNEGLKHVKTEYILIADCDEKWDKGFLQNLKQIITAKPEALCFRFPRINLPDAKKYPDYQVRLVKTAWTVWKEEPHALPYLRGKSNTDIASVRLDQTTAIETLDNFPILHLARRTDVKRPWWNE